MNTQITVNFFALAVLGAWIPIIFVMFALMKPRRAVIAAFVIGYLFLPEFSYRFHTMPSINKVSLTAVGVILASLIFDGGRLFTVRPKFIDLACVVLLTSPIATSMVNGLGIMDGLSNFLEQLLRWGFAYWLGRAYFTDWESVRDLAIGIILGGIAYMPLCWWEIRMSPMLHGLIYGMLFESFRSDTYLFGIHLFGFRPNVFLANGLTVTMFMGASAVLAFSAWAAGSPKKLLGIPMGWIAFALIVSTVFCKAVGGIVLMTSGITALLFTVDTRNPLVARRLGVFVGTIARMLPKSRIPALLLLLAAPFYMTIRTNNLWAGDTLVEAASILSHTRSESLAFRLENEDKLLGKALRRPMFGWGGWGRSMVYDFDDQNITIADGLWIITLGQLGLVGLGALVTLVIGTALMIWWRIPRRFWTDPACAAPVALCVVLGMYMVDSLFNATFNPIASLAVGALATIAGLSRKTFANVPKTQPARRGFPVMVSNAKDIPYAYPAYRS